MPSPALVIGLGGSGTWVATYVKKELLEASGIHDIRKIHEVKIIAFDTIPDSEAQVGGRGDMREVGESTGAVKLGKGEFFFIGGNVKKLMREVGSGRHPHIRSWLRADWYLRTLPDKSFNLNEGAGQFRQFGRAAVFKDVAQPPNSRIYGALSDALVKIKRSNPTMEKLQVFIVGSLAGGRGQACLRMSLTWSGKLLLGLMWIWKNKRQLEDI